MALLERARRRQHWILALTAIGFSAAGLLVATPIVLAIASTGHRAAAPLAWAAGLGALGAFGWLYVLRARRQIGNLNATARLLADQLDDPGLRRDLVAAVELLRDADGEQAWSSELARAHVEAVGRNVDKADLTRALPDKPVRIAGFAFSGAMAICLAALLIFGSTLMRGLERLVLPARTGSSAAAAVEPITGEIALTYVYPAHTHLATRTVPNTNGEIVAPKGTEVRLKTRADREVAKAYLVINDAVLPLDVENGRDLAGALVVQGPGSYRFRFEDARGRMLAEGPAIPIAVEEDGAPKAEILAPITEIEVDPADRVPIRFEAEDDYGLSEVALVFKLPGASKHQRIVLQRQADAPRRASGEHQWELVKLGLMAGDRVPYYIEATDNDAVSGRKTGVSRTQYLKVYSEAEHHRQVIAKIEAKWEELILLLADRLEAPERHGATEPAAVMAQEQVDVRGERLAQEFSELAAELKKDKAPDELRRALVNVGTGLRKVVRQTASARSTFGMMARRANGQMPSVKALERALAAEIAEEEKDILYLEALLDQQRIQDLVALAKEMGAKRRELANLLEQYRQAPDEDTRDRIMSEIARLKERMAELQRRMAELSRSISDDHVNAEALKELAKEKDMMSSFDRIQQLLHEGKVEEAMKELEKLGTQLDEMQQNLQRAADDFQGSPEMQELGRQLNEFSEKLDALQQEQEALLRETQEIRNNYKDALKQRLEQKGPDFVEKLRKKVEKAQKRLSEVSDVRASHVDHELRAAREELEQLDQALQVQDFDQAAQAAAKALERAQMAAAYLEQSAEDARRYRQQWPDLLENVQRNAKSAQAAVPPIEEVKKELDQLFPPPAQMMSEQDRQRMRQQAQRQQQMQQQAQQLRKQMDELNQKAPIFSPEAQQMMEQSGQRMGRAQSQLQSRNPTGAMAEQRAALDQLSDLKKGLEQSGKGGGSGGQAVPWPWQGPGSPDSGGEGGMGRHNPNEKVVIPGAEQHQVPEEYRKDILDAMKQGTPEKYREQVKRYYEEIVK